MQNNKAQLNPETFKSLLLSAHPDATASDGRKYADIPALELTQKAVKSHPDGVTNTGIKYSDYLSSNPEIGTGSDTYQGTLTGPDNKIGSLPVIKQATQVGTGIGSALGKIGLGLGKTVLKLSSPVANLLGVGQQNKDAQMSIDTLSQNIFDKPVQQELGTTGGKVGTAIGQIAPYIATAGSTSALANSASGSIKGTGVLPALGRTAASAGTEAATNFGTAYALSGGDVKQAKNQALTAGLLKAGTAGIGEIANGLKVPESLMTKIFKTDKNEMSGLLSGSQEDSLAKQALDRGIKGNTENIAKQLGAGMVDSEAKISAEFAKAGNPPITLEEPKRFINYIKETADRLRKSGAIKEATGLESTLGAIDPNTGQISANNALALRRFLDGLRYQKSYLSPTEELSAQQAGLKEMTDEIRHKINAIGNTGEAMKDYAFNIKAMDRLVKHAVRTKNNDALGALNTIMLGESLANASPLLGIGTIGRKLISTTSGYTRTAQGLKNLPKSKAIGSVSRTIAGQGINTLLK